MAHPFLSLHVLMILWPLFLRGPFLYCISEKRKQEKASE